MLGWGRERDKEPQKTNDMTSAKPRGNNRRENVGRSGGWEK